MSSLVASIMAQPPIPDELTVWGKFVMFMAALLVNWGFIISFVAICGFVAFFFLSDKFHGQGIIGNTIGFLTELIDRALFMALIALITASGGIIVEIFQNGLSGAVTSLLTAPIAVIATLVVGGLFFVWKQFYYLAHAGQSWIQDISLDGVFALIIMFLNYMGYGAANAQYSGTEILEGFFERWLQSVRALSTALGFPF